MWRQASVLLVVVVGVGWTAVDAARHATTARSEHARRGIVAAEDQLAEVLAEQGSPWVVVPATPARHPFTQVADYRRALVAASEERARAIAASAPALPAIVTHGGERWLVRRLGSQVRVREWGPVSAAITRDTGVTLDLDTTDGIPFLPGGFGSGPVTARVPDPSGLLLPWLDVARAVAVVFAVGLLVRERLRVHHARDRDQTRDLLLQRISHELRTPAASIRSLSDALVAGAVTDPASQRQFLALLGTEAERLAVGVDRLVRASRGDDSSYLSPVPLDLADWTKGIAERWRARIPALRVDVPEVAPWRADPERLEEAVEALLDNAAKHGGPNVRIAVTVGGDRVRIVVEDDGPGVPKADRQRVFERLQRVEGRAGDAGGYGLGLWAASEVARAHRGTLTLEGGSRFVLTLPEVR